MLGVLYSALIEGRVIVAPWLRTATTVGLVGAYTTFSTLTLETMRLIEDGSLALAGLNAVGGLAVGLLAVYVGIVLGRLIYMRFDGEGKLLRIFIGESDRFGGKPLYQAIVEKSRVEGLAGATVLRGIERFGAESHLHTSRILRLSEDLPIVIEIVDTADHIDRMLPVSTRWWATG